MAAATSALRNGRNLPSQVSALAILIPQRGYATEQSNSTSSQSYPPPGFNAEQAKKPIPQDQVQSAQKPAKPETVAPGSTDNKLASKAVAAEAEKNAVVEKETKKLTLGQKVKKEVQHYWDGTKLLATEVKISTRLALKMAGGYELSRREHRQVFLLPFKSEIEMGTGLTVVFNSCNVPQKIWAV